MPPPAAPLSAAASLSTILFASFAGLGEPSTAEAPLAGPAAEGNPQPFQVATSPIGFIACADSLGVLPHGIGGQCGLDCDGTGADCVVSSSGPHPFFACWDTDADGIDDTCTGPHVGSGSTGGFKLVLNAYLCLFCLNAILPVATATVPGATVHIDPVHITQGAFTVPVSGPGLLNSYAAVDP